MWKHPAIDNLQSGPLTRKADGYLLNIQPSLMAKDLEPFEVQSDKAPLRTFGQDAPVISFPRTADDRIDMTRLSEIKPVWDMIKLRFDSEEQARGTSLGQYWHA